MTKEGGEILKQPVNQVQGMVQNDRKKIPLLSPFKKGAFEGVRDIFAVGNRSYKQGL